MRSFFRALEAREVEFVLISGQAAVVYGAATFSEDFDLWVRPTTANLRRLLTALADASARVHKLTPPVTLANARRGHGFHFRLPDPPREDAYVDVMARPPRVGAFGPARRRSQVMLTPWGALPVVSIDDLVRLKLTRRLADYDVISNLARIRLQREQPPSARLARWAIATTFRVDDVVDWATRWPAVDDALRASTREALRPIARGDRSQTAVEAAMMAVARDVAVHQAADIAHWRSVIDELRTLRASGGLLVEGTRVEAP